MNNKTVIKIIEERKGGLVFSAFRENKVIGSALIRKSIDGSFKVENGSEYQLLSLEADYMFKGEGVEGIIIDEVINYINKENSILVVYPKNIENLDVDFFIRRGFKFEAIIYHDSIYVYGENYLYNLERIDKDCLEHLDKERFRKSKE